MIIIYHIALIMCNTYNRSIIIPKRYNKRKYNMLQNRKIKLVFGKSMEGGCWKDGIAAYPVFQGSGGGEKLHESRGAAGDRAAAPEPSDPGSGGGAGDDIVPSHTP